MLWGLRNVTMSDRNNGITERLIEHTGLVSVKNPSFSFSSSPVGVDVVRRHIQGRPCRRKEKPSLFTEQNGNLGKNGYETKRQIVSPTVDTPVKGSRNWSVEG